MKNQPKEFGFKKNNFFSFLAAMMLAYQPISSLATINLLVYQGTTAAKRIFDVIDEPIETYEVGQQATMAASDECRCNSLRELEPSPDANEPDGAPSLPGEKRTMIQGPMIENRRNR